MNMHRFSKFLLPIALLAVATMLAHPRVIAAPSGNLALSQAATVPFRFAVFGDTRFTNPADTKPANPAIRQAIVRAIANQHPVFISISGDIVYDGDNTDDWKVWDSETSAWRAEKIPVYPALGNHDLHGDEATALGNYFARFPELQQHRYYSVRIANCLMLLVDSALDENSGSQGDWLRQTLDNIPQGVKFVMFVMHHPPYTSSSSDGKSGGGHSVRAREQALGAMLEQRQQHTAARFVVFAGHIHNYERHEHGGVTYFVTGGGGAQPYLVTRDPQDPLFGSSVNYHYLLVDVTEEAMTVTMNRIELNHGQEAWSQPDKVTITARRR